MIAALLFSMQAMVEPPPPDHHVFDNEVDGGLAFDAAMYCLAGAASRFNAPPDKAMVAVELGKCSAQTRKLRQELVKIFVAHPSRMPSGLSPTEAADQFVSNLLNRFDYLLREPARAEK